MGAMEPPLRTLRRELARDLVENQRQGTTAMAPGVLFEDVPFFLDPARFPAFAETGFHQTPDLRFYHEAAVRGTIALTIAEPLSHRHEVAREMAMSLGAWAYFGKPMKASEVSPWLDSLVESKKVLQ